jgi:hypothetical protein
MDGGDNAAMQAARGNNSPSHLALEPSAQVARN